MPGPERQARDEAAFLVRISALMPNIVVSEAGEGFSGFAAWEGALLGQIFVDGAFRGTGLAQALMLAAETRMAAQGASLAELHCLVGNARARRFYERLGWSIAETLAEPVKGEDGHETRDFWIMRKHVAL